MLWCVAPSPKEAKENKRNEEISKKALLKTAKTISFKSPQKDVANFLKEISQHLERYNTYEIHKLHELISECYKSIINEKENNSFNELKHFLAKI